MSSTSTAEPVTPTQLYGAVADARARADAAEVEVLVLAVHWAYAHLADPGWDVGPAGRGLGRGLGRGQEDPEEEPDDWFGIPEIRWDAPAGFGAANRMSTDAGRRVLRDALILCHRLPRVWARVTAGEVAAWRARRIAASVASRPDDVAQFVDTALAPRAHAIGSVGLDRLIDQALLALHPEERELDQLEALDRRHATLDERTLNDTGIAEMVLRADWADLKEFDQALGAVAAAIKTTQAEGWEESLDVRRALAVGILADPETALALLQAAELASAEPGAAEPHDEAPPARPRRRRLEIVVHLTDAALLGLDPTARDDRDRALLAEVVRAWASRSDTQLTVKPVLDLATNPAAPGYRIPDNLRDHVVLRDTTCVFPWCTRSARDADLDHAIAYDFDDPMRGGSTSADNLAPLCRHHHRIKTFTGWSYEHLDPGRFVWQGPHGQQFLTGHEGTHALPHRGMVDSRADSTQSPG